MMINFNRGNANDITNNTNNIFWSLKTLKSNLIKQLNNRETEELSLKIEAERKIGESDIKATLRINKTTTTNSYTPDVKSFDIPLSKSDIDLKLVFSILERALRLTKEELEDVTFDQSLMNQIFINKANRLFEKNNVRMLTILPNLIFALNKPVSISAIMF